MYLYLTFAIGALVLAAFVASTIPSCKKRALWYEDSVNRPYADMLRAVEGARENWKLYRQGHWLVGICLAYAIVNLFFAYYFR